MRPFLCVVGVAALVALAGRARGASEEDCRRFHQECEDAKAVSDADAGICNVERLECGGESDSRPEAGVRKRLRSLEPTGGAETPASPEHSIGP